MIGPLLNWFRRDVLSAIEEGGEELHDEEPEHRLAELDIRDGWLEGPGVEHDTSPRWSRSPALEREGPALIVTHATATPWGTGPTLRRAIRTHGERAASWHVLIYEDGTIVQSIPFTRASWNAGSGTAARLLLPTGPAQVNLHSVGIELVNAGEVRSIAGQWRSWPFAGGPGRKPGPVINVGQTVVIAGARRYQLYPTDQMLSYRRVLAAIRAAYALRMALPVRLIHRTGRVVTLPAWRVGHVDVDPTRKTDPYPSFPWPEHPWPDAP